MKNAYIISADRTVGNRRWLQVCISRRESRRTHWKIFTLEGLPLDCEGELQTSHFIQINCKLLFFRYKEIFCFTLLRILTYSVPQAIKFEKGQNKTISCAKPTTTALPIFRPSETRMAMASPISGLNVVDVSDHICS